MQRKILFDFCLFVLNENKNFTYIKLKRSTKDIFLAAIQVNNF